jgi:polyisoprenoid-binding protein YceI
VIKFLAILLSAIVSTSAWCGTVTGKATWQAVGTPGFLRINGEGGTVNGDVVKGPDGKVTGVFKVKLSDYKTGMDLRDTHMKDKYLEVAKFPYATLKLESVAPTEAEFAWTGTLELKGETKPVKGTATVKEGKLSASFAITIKDYPSIGVPAHLGVTVADKVTVVVEGEVK